MVCKHQPRALRKPPPEILISLVMLCFSPHSLLLYHHYLPPPTQSSRRRLCCERTNQRECWLMAGPAWLRALALPSRLPIMIIIIVRPLHQPLYTIHPRPTHRHKHKHEASDVPSATVHVLLHGAAARPALCLLQGQSKTQATARAWGASQAAHRRGGCTGGRGRRMRVRRPPPPPC